MPIVWRTLQIHPSAVQRIQIIDDLKTVREIVHKLQRPAIAPKRVYVHDWHEGDLVVGAIAKDQIRQDF